MGPAFVIAVVWAMLAQVAAPPPQESKPAAENAPQETAGQPPQVLVNSGKPMQLPFQCTEDDIQWAGLSCTDEDPCPIYLELTAVESVGNKLFAVGNVHSPTMTLYSILLASDDAGKNWREPHQRLRGSSLDQIQFVDFENGWISGQLLHPLPRDPFLLITSDGGKSWRRRPVFGESRPGAVLQFWFQSRTSGALVVDRQQSEEGSRYELYESPNGGETWMIRESNDRPIRLKRSPAAGGWRIRADGKTKAFHIERQAGEQWQSVSAFQIPVAPCRPEPRAQPQPPQEPDAPAAESAAPASPAPPRRPPTLNRPPR
jgi:hypothetical protein